jgi:putative PIN family toxin of toxin-antitoxin system
MRVVLDTNVLARPACNPAGLAGDLLSWFRRPEHILVLSPFILEELERVLRYPRMLLAHGLDDTAILQYVSSIAAAGLLVRPGPAASVVTADPDDDPIIAAAVEGHADVICTRDRHLTQPSVVAHLAVQGIRVLSDLELLQLLRSLPPATP